MKIEFIKIPSHLNVKFMEDANTIAKRALLAKGYKTYNDGSVYFVGYSNEDWDTIIELINDENIGLLGNSYNHLLSVSKETIGNRTKVKITQAKSRVTINCYNNSNSFVQGKPTPLFQKIVATAIGLMENKQEVIETLNNYHALTIREEEVEMRFEKLLPHYVHYSPKHYSNLLSAVYNSMLTGYMPDYTCLITPIFRAYEYYLHRILGDMMGLETVTAKGINNLEINRKVALHQVSSFLEINRKVALHQVSSFSLKLLTFIVPGIFILSRLASSFTCLSGVSTWVVPF